MTRDELPGVFPLGDTALVVTFGDEISSEIHRKVLELAMYLDSAPPVGMIEYIPAFTTVTLLYNPLVRSYDEFAGSVRDALRRTPSGEPASRREPVEIPVCYGNELGPDLEFVADHNQLRTDDVIEIHSSATYIVYMIGFAPGFPYLGGMSSQIAAPRLDVPRAQVPAGSVGIAGRQTGVYPIATPGGWRLIGRSPERLFDPDARRPSHLEAGDEVRFTPISRSEYDRLSERATDR